MSATTGQATGAPAIRPFQVDTSDEALDDLRRRVAATNWPEKETVADQSQGVPLAIAQELARYWATDYDWAQLRGQAKGPTALHDRDRRA
jgi:hypothetical protein